MTKKIKRFWDIDEALASAKTVHEVYVPEIDAVVRFSLLNNEDFLEIQRKSKNDVEAGLFILWRMLSKVDPKVTVEKLKQLPVDVTTAILNAINKYTHTQKVPFLKAPSEVAG